MSHKFQLRQLVRFTQAGYSSKHLGFSGDYEVTRLLPQDQTGEFTYRIKSTSAGERAARESDLSARRLDA